METYIRKINYYETDQMGCVHHSNYIRYFEEARTWFMEQAGYPYSRVEREGVISPVVSVSCQYKHPVHYGETVAIRTRLTGMTRVRFFFRYEVVDAETGQLRATGESEHCYLDRDGRIVSMQKVNPAFYECFLAAMDQE
ncbi:MAG: acyl-CoA thioesterase [Oscillospiraceae bacterium]|nr:acyl-CoA thioesterase [Oscillospiraceae bacterium]